MRLTHVKRGIKSVILDLGCSLRKPSVQNPDLPLHVNSSASVYYNIIIPSSSGKISCNDLNLIRKDSIFRNMISLLPPANARVVTVAAQTCRLELAEGSRVEAVVRGKLYGKDRSGVVVGDQVVTGNQNGQWTVEQVLERKNEFVRQGLRKERQVMFANVDRVLIVASLEQPETKAASIDRFLVTAMHGGIPADLVLTKLDLDEEGIRTSELREMYETLNMPVYPVSNETGEGLEPVANLMSHGITSIIGNSGVGKSSLLNRLIPGLELRVREVSEWTGKGTHTTTASVLISYNDNASVIDTPGMKSFTPFGITKDNLVELFPEFVAIREQCRFSDCKHINEPDCAVLAAVEAGVVQGSRLRSYYRLLEGIAKLY
jgi:ribosome biogenesis GTPase